MDFATSAYCPHRRPTARRSWLRSALLLGLALAPVIGAYGQRSVTRIGNSPGQNTSQLAIQVNDDKMTVAAARATQVYLYGTIDADAPNRFEMLLRSRKIPAQSDIYLDSPGGDLNAALALGRLFRSRALITHLGVRRRAVRSGEAPQAAVCVGACTYAYFGGLYRWSPTGNDRIGLHAFHTLHPSANDASQAQQTSPEVIAYLKEMGIDPEAFTPTLASSKDDIVWFSAEQMLDSGLANNGNQPPTATFQGSTAPLLSINQIVNRGVNRITVLCKPDSLTLTSYYIVGANRAQSMVTHGTRAYFEVNEQEVQPPQERVSTLNEAVVITRPYPTSSLGHLVLARSVGAWLSDRKGAVRYGFTLQLAPVRSVLRDYYSHCADVINAAAAANE